MSGCAWRGGYLLERTAGACERLRRAKLKLGALGNVRFNRKDFGLLQRFVNTLLLRVEIAVAKAGLNFFELGALPELVLREDFL